MHYFPISLWTILSVETYAWAVWKPLEQWSALLCLAMYGLVSSADLGFRQVGCLVPSILELNCSQPLMASRVGKGTS